MKNIVSNLRKLRLDKGYTLAALSEIIGVSDATLQRYESGEIKTIKPDTLIKLADVLGCTDPMYILGYERPSYNTYEPTKNIPVLGTVSAGLPIYAEENYEGYTCTDELGEDLYALKVKGDSMNAAGINQGDILIFRRQPTVENGEIAVVMVNGSEATVKKFYQNGNQITLFPQSNNPVHQPQIYDIADTDIQIIGKVVESKTRF